MPRGIELCDADYSARLIDVTKAVNNLIEVIAGWRPEEVAGTAIARANVQCYCVVLDLGKLGLSSDAATSWLEQYNGYVATLAPQFGVKHPYPKVAILGHGLERDVTRRLRFLGAIVFDSARPSHQQITTVDALAKAIELQARQVDEMRRRSNSATLARSRVPRELDEENRRILNSYPEGVTREQLDEMLGRRNSET